MKDKKIDKYIKEQSSKLTKGLIDRRQFMMSVLATVFIQKHHKIENF